MGIYGDYEYQGYLVGLHRISYPAPAPAGIRPFFHIRPNPAPAGYQDMTAGFEAGFIKF